MTKITNLFTSEDINEGKRNTTVTSKITPELMTALPWNTACGKKQGSPKLESKSE